MAGGGRERIWESEMNESCWWPPSLWSTEYEKILVWSRSQLSWLKCDLSFLCSWFLLFLQQASSHCIFQSVLSAGSGWTEWPGKRADFSPLEHFDGERAEGVSAFEWIKRGYRRDQWSRRHLRWAQVPEAIVLNLLLSQIHVQYKARACHNQMHALQPHQKTITDSSSRISPMMCLSVCCCDLLFPSLSSYSCHSLQFLPLLMEVLQVSRGMGCISIII